MKTTQTTKRSSYIFLLDNEIFHVTEKRENSNKHKSIQQWQKSLTVYILRRSKRKKNRQGAKKRQQLLQLSEIEMDHEGVVTFSHRKLFVQ